MAPLTTRPVTNLQTGKLEVTVFNNGEEPLTLRSFNLLRRTPGIRCMGVCALHSKSKRRFGTDTSKDLLHSESQDN
jgi:hypothetical protein